MAVESGLDLLTEATMGTERHGHDGEGLTDEERESAERDIRAAFPDVTDEQVARCLASLCLCGGRRGEFVMKGGES